MSLDFDVTKVKNFNEKFPSVIDEDGEKCWNPVIQPVVFYCLFLGIREINQSNVGEFMFRYTFYNKLFGNVYRQAGEDGTRVDFEITEDMIVDLIGLSTNVSYEKRNGWVRRMIEIFIRENGFPKKETP